MAHYNPSYYDSVRGVVILVKLPSALESVWAAAADQAGAESYATQKWEDSYVVAGGKRPTTVVTLASGGLDPRLFDNSDATYRAVAPIILTESDDEKSLWRRLAWDALLTSAPKSEVVAAIMNASAEARQRCVDWDLVEDYHQRERSLSNDERHVLASVCAGKLNKQIANELNVSIRTVEQRRRRVFSKMGVESAVPLADFAATVRTLEQRVYRHDRGHTLRAPNLFGGSGPHIGHSSQSIHDINQTQ